MTPALAAHRPRTLAQVRAETIVALALASGNWVRLADAPEAGYWMAECAKLRARLAALDEMMRRS